jgi:hypothetical protein
MQPKIDAASVKKLSKQYLEPTQLPPELQLLPLLLLLARHLFQERTICTATTIKLLQRTLGRSMVLFQEIPLPLPTSMVTTS